MTYKVRRRERFVDIEMTDYSFRNATETGYKNIAWWSQANPTRIVIELRGPRGGLLNRVCLQRDELLALATRLQSDVAAEFLDQFGKPKPEEIPS